MTCTYCRKPGCRIGRPLCRKMRSKSAKYRTCECGGYHFPHREGSGCCYKNPNAARLQWERNTGLSWEESS